MKRLRVARLVILFIALYLPLSAAPSRLPQSPSKQPAGKIMGTLLDINGGRVANAKVRVASADFKWEGESEERGDFTVEVPEGEYWIPVQAVGFRDFEGPYLAPSWKQYEFVVRSPNTLRRHPVLLGIKSRA
jgi:hypothetical protein